MPFSAIIDFSRSPRCGTPSFWSLSNDWSNGLAQADTFVFDKTGTLTTGSPAVTDAITFDFQCSAEDLI